MSSPSIPGVPGTERASRTAGSANSPQEPAARASAPARSPRNPAPAPVPEATPATAATGPAAPATGPAAPATADAPTDRTTADATAVDPPATTGTGPTAAAPVNTSDGRTPTGATVVDAPTDQAAADATPNASTGRTATAATGPAVTGTDTSSGRPATDDTPAAPPVFAVRNLWKVFGPKADRIPGDAELTGLPAAELRERTGCTAAVRDVSFDVRKGEVFVVMGLSGSGKSTLVRCLTRLIEPTSGTVEIDGEDIVTMDRTRLRELRRHRAAMVFQHFGLLPHRSVLDNVAYGLEIQGMGRAERREKAAEMVAKVGLGGLEERRPGQLSGGQQQRVGLARALAVDPEVLLFDEPFSALDPLIRRDMQEEVVRLHQEEGRTMIFITHDLNEALRLGDRIALMRDGRVVQLGTPEEIVGSPADDYVRDFVRDVPREQVVTVRSAMRPPCDGPGEGPAVAPGATVSEAIEAVARTGGQVRVVEGGRCVGVVDQQDLLAVVAGLPVAPGGKAAA